MPSLTLPFNKTRFLKFLRTIHAWIGIFVMPWIIVIGLTGLYLNHARAFSGMIDGTPYDESSFADDPRAMPRSLEEAQTIAKGYWPDEAIKSSRAVRYHGHPAFEMKKDSGQIIVASDTGHYFVKSNFRRFTYAPDGTLLHRHYYWGVLFKYLHTRGWFNSSLGTWLADITSVSMLIFGLSGIFLWWMPRANRFRRALFARG